VIGETLERATESIKFDDTRVIQAIKETIAADEEPPKDYDRFRSHPLASWIESTFGVREELGSRQLVRQVPRRLKGEPIEGQVSASAELAELVGVQPDQCAVVLQQYLLQGASLRRSESSRFPIFAFRLHQFFTRGDTVWTTIEPESVRHLELAKKAAKPGEPDKRLFPLAFCRHCGTSYYRVKLIQDEHGKKLLPRDDRRENDDDGEGDAYVYLSEQSPWPRGDGRERLERLPEFLKETTSQGVERIRADARGDVPDPVFIDATGRLVSEGDQWHQ
jgi:hypothetical protein